MLVGPSNKDFYAMLEFMYQQFDPTFKIGKPEDDIVFMLKAMKYVLTTRPRLNIILMWSRYPIPISKRNITGTIGAPHTWPPFLAALNWVVELLRVLSH
jgi:SMC interacting uncharacterized protein involved in chromosome segregation